MRRKNILFVFAQFILIFLSISGGYSQNQPDSLLYHFHNTGETKKALFDYRDGKLKTVSHFVLNDTSLLWKAGNRSSYTTSGDTIITTNERFDTTTNKYIPTERWEEILSAGAEKRYEAKYTYNGVRKIFTGLESRCERKFSTDGDLSEFRYSCWDTISGQWRPYSSGQIFFSTAHKADSALYSVHDLNGQATYSSKTEYSYTPDGELQSATTYSYDTGNKSFNPVFKQDYVVDDTLRRETVHLYVPTRKSWQPLQQTEEIRKYSIFNSFTISDYDSTTGNWLVRYQHSFENRSNNDTTAVNINHYPGGKFSYTETFAQKESAKNSYTGSLVWTDAEGSSSKEKQAGTTSDNKLLNLVYQDAYNHAEIDISLDSLSRPMEYHVNSINENSGQKTAERSIYFYYKPKPTEIRNPVAEADLIRFYPNPATEYLNIKCKENTACFDYQIFTAEGKRILAGHIRASHTTLSLRTLQPGIYILQISTKEKSQSGVFIKKL